MFLGKIYMKEWTELEESGLNHWIKCMDSTSHYVLTRIREFCDTCQRIIVLFRLEMLKRKFHFLISLTQRNSAWASLQNSAPITTGVMMHIKQTQHGNLKLNWDHRNGKISKLRNWMMLSQKKPWDHVPGKHTKILGSYPFLDLDNSVFPLIMWANKLILLKFGRVGFFCFFSKSTLTN